ncbi:MAG: hypothetical protein STSR0008_06580 [Ignavibacterium sp.]
MKIKYISVLIFTICLGSFLSAQTFKPSLFSLENNNYQKIVNSSSDSLRILAVMVEFQEDKDETTVGDGKFNSIYKSNYGNDILDPLPHNKNYFSSHLEFAKNYFQKVSSGKLNVDYFVLDSIITVSKTMKDYSPPIQSTDFSGMANFIVEVWEKVVSVYPNFDFSNYDMFVIFHAGVGRDIAVPGSLGNERDLPSVYFNLNTLKNYLGNDFDGISISNGSFKIQNTAILPQTENREIQSLNQTALLQITINGLLAGSIGSYLGLPDLFNTETGLSAIGRFGLMDGQSLFAYNGAFPPEPSAWEKIELGWAEPIEINLANLELSNSNNINLLARLAAEASDTVILKVPINSSEYYLVENRQRDVFEDGSKITMKIGEQYITNTYQKDTTGFYSYDVDSLSGVITDIDEFDWALPGKGILIWHIDEKIIQEKIAENKINVDKNNRGVDLEEADGIQDIGEEFTTPFGDVVIGEGTQEDFWFASNEATLYKNKFDKSTRPNTNANDGANSLISFSDFSELSNKMSFIISFGDSLVKPIFKKKFFALSENPFLSNLNINNQTFLYLFSKPNIYKIDLNGNVIDSLNNFSNYKPALLFVNNTEYIVGVYDSLLKIYSNSNNTKSINEINTNEFISSPPIISKDEQGIDVIYFGTYTGKLFTYDLNGNLIDIKTGPDGSIEYISAFENYYSFISINYLSVIDKISEIIVNFVDNNGNKIIFSKKFLQLASTKNSNNDIISILLFEKNTFVIISNGNIVNQFTIDIPEPIENFSLTDLNNDGENYLVFNAGNYIYAYNISGTLKDNFPFKDPSNIGFTGIPINADFNGDTKSEIISTTKDGRIFAIDGGNGKFINAFPISIGDSISATPIYFYDNEKISFAILNSSNDLMAYNIGSTEGKIYWSGNFGNEQNNSFVNKAENTNKINQFFPTTKAYNYPNPVYRDETYIRFYVSENSKVNIKIFDLAGDFVAELNAFAQGGMDGEIPWNINNIQSGVYFARIEAVSQVSNKSEYAIIKIAVEK